MRLSGEEIAFFKQYGYLIKRCAMSEEQCSQARKRMWECDPPTHLLPIRDGAGCRGHRQSCSNMGTQTGGRV